MYIGASLQTVIFKFSLNELLIDLIAGRFNFKLFITANSLATP